MTNLEEKLNDLLVRIYRSVEALEEEMLRSSNKQWDLSINEIHMLEAVAASQHDDGATISDLSEYMHISLPSVTLAINKLVRKGYVEKKKSQNDGRVVHVQLTREGRRAERAHRYFHQTMVHSLTADLDDDERRALLTGVGKLNDFLDKNIQKYKEKQ